MLIERGDIEAVMTRRDGRALLIVDVAVPRDIDPGVAQVFGVTLLDIDDLKAFAEQSLEHRRQEIGRVREIINEELDRFRDERSAREVAPLVAALRRRARGSCGRRSSSASPCPARRARPRSPRDRRGLTRGLVNKLLHEPTVRREGRGRDRHAGELYADALAELFDLDEVLGLGERPTDDEG